MFTKIVHAVYESKCDTLGNLEILFILNTKLLKYYQTRYFI